MTKPRDYKREYALAQSSPAQIADRSSRNKARRKLVAAGVDVAGKDVDHIDGSPKNNSRRNLQAISPSKNRSKK